MLNRMTRARLSFLEFSRQKILCCVSIKTVWMSMLLLRSLRLKTHVTLVMMAKFVDRRETTDERHS